jgi:apolipoprotein N-acyltransferase
MVRMRAIENHRWILRATNTGVTASIDPYGRVVAAAPRHVRTSIRVRFGYENDLTFYAAHGDWFAWACAVASAAALFAGLRRRFAVN